MIYLWFIIPFTIGVVAIFFPGYIHFGGGVDTSDWSLYPSLRVGRGTEEGVYFYYLMLDFLCFGISIGFSKEPIEKKLPKYVGVKRIERGAGDDYPIIDLNK